MSTRALHLRTTDAAAITRAFTLTDGDAGREPTTTEDGKRVYWALAYRYEVADRHRTTIRSGGLRSMKAGSFPILAVHDRQAFPVAKAVEVDHTDPAGPWVGMVFADTERGREAEQLVAEDYLKGVSIGFMPVDEKEISSRSDGILEFGDCEVLELSIVPCPSSREALFDLARSATELGMDTNDLAELAATARAAEVAETAGGTESGTDLELRLVQLETRLAALEGREAQPADLSAPAQPDPADAGAAEGAGDVSEPQATVPAQNRNTELLKRLTRISR